MGNSNEKIVEILTGSKWEAGLENYDYGNTLSFQDNNLGNVQFAGAQRIIFVADFEYRIVTGPNNTTTFVFHYKDTSKLGTHFKENTENEQQEVDFILLPGLHKAKNPWNKDVAFSYLLQLHSSPFPRYTDAAFSSYLDYYGWKR